MCKVKYACGFCGLKLVIHNGNGGDMICPICKSSSLSVIDKQPCQPAPKSQAQRKPITAMALAMAGKKN